MKLTEEIEITQYADALEAALGVYGSRDPFLMSLASGATYEPERQRFSVKYCGVPCEVTYPGGEVYVKGHGPSDGPDVETREAGRQARQRVSAPATCTGERKESGALCWNITSVERILMLKYLSSYGGVAPVGRWVSFEELKCGPHHSKPFRDLAINPLAERFGENGEDFEARRIGLGGSRLVHTKGALAFSIPTFPKVYLSFILWCKDEEFDARAQILFDAACEHHFDTASLYMLGMEVSSRILGKASPTF